MLLILLAVISLFSTKNATVFDSKELLQPPANVKGDFTIASAPPRVEVILFNGLPEGNKSTLWTSWGNGLVASNGKYYAAIGNHQSFDGDSYVYEYVPSNGTLNKIIDVASAIGQKPGQFGHGKIHTPIVEYQKSLYFATYWGKRNDMEDGKKTDYKGSLFFRYDLKTQKLENLGEIAPGQGLPACVLDSSRGLLYFYAMDDVEKGNFLVYDLKKRSVKFKGGTQNAGEFRAFLLAADGKLYFSDDKGVLSFYDPQKNSVGSTKLILPGEKNNALRAAARVASNGSIFGMTHTGRLFEFQPAKESIKDLGPNFLSGDYTAVMLLSPDEKFLYYAPGSHGSAIKSGTPVIQYNIAKGTRKVLAFLGPVLQKNGYCIAGNYNLQIDPKGEKLYAIFNGAKIGGEKNQPTFGLPAFVKIAIPASERN